MKNYLKYLKNGKTNEKYLFVFLTSFIIMAAVFLPLIIYNKGYFLYYGDFNSQQLMFYDHVQKAAKNGTLNWDWGTDLGSSFIGAYSFYLLGSPFFWLTTLFPKGAAPVMIPWLLALKTAVASLTAYAYIRRFVKSPEASAAGAFLYGFSGFQIYNVFFNHFHDVTAFFPLMLLALELNIQENRKGFFAVTVCLMAVVNYFFFTGQVTFLIIYFICRCLSKDFKITLKKFGLLALESVTGVMMAAFLLLPAVLGIIENPRIDGFLTGLDMVVYDDKFRIIRIIQSFFMMSDPPARSNLFSSDTARWASIGGYLPLFSMAGVIAFMKTKKKHWAKRVVTVCIIFAFVPILNTSFYMFNSSYYARWYYMPILIMAMMTAVGIEDTFAAEGSGEEAYPEDKSSLADLKLGLPLCAAALLTFYIVALLPSEVSTITGKKKLSFLNIAQYYDLFWIQLGVTVGLTMGLVCLLWKFRKKKSFYKAAMWFTVGACGVYAAAGVWYGVAQGGEPEEFIRKAINGGEQIKLETSEGEFYRIDTSENIDNYCMFWGYPSMRCFQSAVSPSIMEFYIGMGMTRDVASRIETKYYPLRSLLSVKYYVEEKPDEEEEIRSDKQEKGMTGFEYLYETEDYTVYENKNYLPMGFAYDNYITQEEYKELSKGAKAASLLGSLVLTPGQYEKYSGIISKQENKLVVSSEAAFLAMVKERQGECCYYFQPDNDGFTAKISLDSDKLVMFSVPYDKGWSATVNGKNVEVEKVSGGLMAIKVPGGNDSVIRFEYRVYGFREGIIITAAGVIIFAGYLLISRYVSKKKPVKINEKEEREVAEEDVSE